MLSNFFIDETKSKNFLFYATVRYVHHWSRGARSGRYVSVPTPFYPPTTGRRSMRVTVVERSRAQSSLDRRQVCVVDRCACLSLCVDSAWFFVRLASFFPFSLFSLPFSPRFFYFVYGQGNQCVICYMRAQAARRAAGRTSGETRPRRKIKTLCAFVRARSVQYFDYIRDKNTIEANTRGIVKLTEHVSRDMDWALKARRT